jgi:beta-lactam-binding protein with PASTA domain
MTAMESGTPQMPMVIGMELSRAQAVVRSAVADPRFTIQHNDTGTVPPGMVIAQRPRPGSEVTSGSQIWLTVSA